MRRVTVSLMSDGKAFHAAAQLPTNPCPWHVALSDVQQSYSVRQNEAECRHSDRTVLRGIVVRYHAECRTSGCRAWTVFGSTLAASGAAVGEVTRATEEMHHKEVWQQRLAHDEVLTVNCKRVNSVTVIQARQDLRSYQCVQCVL